MHIDFSLRNKFVSPTYERLALKRTDNSWRTAALADGTSGILAVWRSKAPFAADNRLVWLSPDQLHTDRLDNAILLGELDGAPCFAVDLGLSDDPPDLGSDVRFENLRSIGALADASNSALAAYALAMVFWHRNSRFCGICGNSNSSDDCGHVLICSNEQCANKQFPRSDPAVIVLVTHDDKALLGRQPSWPAGVYSALAGFVEPGESLEHAVRRDVAEESGVLVDQVRYHASQPWPFPSSLMLGFFATASDTRTECKDDELEDVRWFTRADIIEQIGQNLISLSAQISIASRLIEHWFDEGNPGAYQRMLAAKQR